ncbi:MAG: TPM domain-containing protein [Sphingomonadales bacterium]|nr:TPM domain-containing protein [Sphingomonadales bacterium]
MPLPFRAAAAALLLALAALLPGAARAQTFPALSGRVVDAANVLPADVAQRLDGKLAALETQSHRQLVVATVPDLQGYEISDYGYRLGRAWGIGDKQRNDGVILLVAPKERKVRIEVGYGLEPVLTDGFSSLIIQQQIIPRFKSGDMPGGIEAGADAIIHQLQLPPEEARKIAAQPAPAQRSDKGGWLPALFWLGFFFLFFVLPFFRRRGGRAYGFGLGQVILWSALDSAMRGGRRGGGWSSGGGGDWGGGGGFSGGGGSFGGGGSSGSW